MGNTVKGDVLLEVAGEEYTLRPTYHAIAAIEGRTGDSIVDLIRRSAGQRPKATDVFTVLLEGSRAGGKAIPSAALGRYVLHHFREAGEAAGQFLDRAFPPPEEDAGEGKAQPTAS